MKKKEIVNNINLYFKYIYLIHLFIIIFIMFLFQNEEVIGVFGFSFFSLISYIFIKNNLNMYKNKLKKEFSKNVKIWLKEKKDLIFIMFLLNIVNLLFFLLENIIPSLLSLFINLIISIVFIVIYMNFLFNNKLLNNYSLSKYIYFDNKIKYKTQKYLDLVENIFKDKKTNLFLFKNISKKNKLKLDNLKKSLKEIDSKEIYKKYIYSIKDFS